MAFSKILQIVALIVSHTHTDYCSPWNSVYAWMGGGGGGGGALMDCVLLNNGAIINRRHASKDSFSRLYTVGGWDKGPKQCGKDITTLPM